jgi:hypothetical protein
MSTMQVFHECLFSANSEMRGQYADCLKRLTKASPSQVRKIANKVIWDIWNN